MLSTRNASIIPQWIASGDNVPADKLSRFNVGDAFRLHPEVFHMLDSLVGGFTVDRFATAANTCCPRFNSYFAEPNALGVDAFAQEDWLEHINYCNPPFS